MVEIVQFPTWYGILLLIVVADGRDTVPVNVGDARFAFVVPSDVI